MTETTTPFAARDAAEFAHLRLQGRAVVLERLFELLETVSQSPKDDKSPGLHVDCGFTRDDAFWYGLRQIVEDIRSADDEVKASGDVIYRGLENR